jgi:outer membrane biosynthesis protein TonB
MEDDNNPLGMPPLAPLATETEESQPEAPPRRRRRREVPAPDSIHDASEEDEKIARLLEDDENSGAQIEISRKTTNNKWALCCVFPLSDWSSDSKVQVANQFGGGTYRAAIRRSDKTFASTFFFEVDPAVKVRTAEAAPAFDMQALVAQLKPTQNDNGFVQMMQAQQAMMMQFMQMQAAQSSENMKALASVIARPVSPSAPMNDRIVEVLLAKALDKPAAMDLPKIIEAVAKLRTVANGGDAGGDDDDEEGGGNSDIFGAVLKSLPALVGMIGGANRVPAIANNPPQPQPQPQPRPRPAPRPAPQQVTPQPAPQPAPAPAPVEQVAPKDYSLLQLFLPQIVGMAEAKQTPTDVAKIIEDTLDGQQLADLKDLLRSDTWFQTLVDLHRPVMTWPRWFARLRENLIGSAKTQVIEAETVPAT